MLTTEMCWIAKEVFGAAHDRKSGNFIHKIVDMVKKNAV
jgi:hypothetical protein